MEKQNLSLSHIYKLMVFAGVCRYVCMKSLEHTGQIENLMSRKSKHIVWHGRQEGEAPHYCFTCEVCLLTNRCLHKDLFTCLSHREHTTIKTRITNTD